MSKTKKTIQHRLILGDALKMLDKVDDKSCRLAISSPPYNVGKEYERGPRMSLEEYLEWLTPIIQKLEKKVASNGHICWQVGNYVKDGAVYPLDYYFYDIFSRLGWRLRNRIIWHFNFGLHAKRRFSGRYETLLWFTKSETYHFNLDPVRVPQLYPGKRHASTQGKRAGALSGNPDGKNPSDYWTFDATAAFLDNPLWDFPNVKSNHPEKTIHPCQFPSELVERCVLAMTKRGDVVIDPFVGVGTTAIAADKHDRFAIGIDKSAEYLALAKQRLAAQRIGKLVTRPLGKPVHKPNQRERVAALPDEWRTKRARRPAAS
jgi:adenine-specific DNA-methyltransferase